MKRSNIQKKDLYLGLLIAVILSSIVCYIVFNNFVLQRGPMRWDESEHSLTALVFANDIYRLDPISLATHMHEQLLWPFAHTLFLSFAYLLFSPGVLVGRSFSLVVYFAFSIAMYFLGREVANRNKDISGVLCSVFALVTGSLYLSASEAMLEITALLFFTLALLFFLKSFKDSRFYYFTSAFTLLAFFSKTNFGIVLVLAFAVYFLVKERFNINRILNSKDFAKLFGPIIVTLMAWLLTPPQRALTFIYFLVNRPEGPPLLSFEGLSYYPSQLYLYSGILLFVFVLAFILAFRYRKDERIKFLIIAGILAILLNFFHQNKKIRYILYLYPVLFSLTAFHITRLFSEIKYRHKRLAFYAIIIASMAAFSVYAYGSIRLYDSYYSVKDPLDFIKNSTAGSENIFILGEFNEISPALISWHLSDINSIKQVKASGYYVWEFDRNSLRNALRMPENATPDAEGMNAFLEKYGFDSIVMIEVKNESVFYSTEDYLVYNKWKLDYMPVILGNGNYSILERRLFDDIKVEITVMRRVSI